MSLVMKRMIIVLTGMAMALFLIPLLSGSFAHAITMERDTADFQSRSQETTGYVECTSGEIKDAVSSNPKVAEVYSYYDHISIEPNWVGKATITVTGQDESTAEIKVNVSEKYMKQLLKWHTSPFRNWYGSKKLTLYSAPGTTGKIVIGKNTYKFSMGKKDKISFKLKKVYKLNTKIKATLKNYGITTTETWKVYSDTNLEEVAANGKKVDVRIWNLHKGDKVKVKFKGKTYTKKIKKNYDSKSYTVKFKLKKKPAYDAKLVITIINKDKKTLRKETAKLSNFIYYHVDEWE